MTDEKGVSKRARKLGITIGGGVLLILGIIAIPYPGPGWLIVFAALGLLAQEYPWAKRVLDYTRKQYDRWNAWIKRQNVFIKSLTFIFTVLVVVVTIWLLNGYGLLNELFNWQQDWLRSPILKVL